MIIIKGDYICEVDCDATKGSKQLFFFFNVYQRRLFSAQNHCVTTTNSEGLLYEWRLRLIAFACYCTCMPSDLM